MHPGKSFNYVVLQQKMSITLHNLYYRQINLLQDNIFRAIGMGCIDATYVDRWLQLRRSVQLPTRVGSRRRKRACS